jgi:tRNA(Ile)-lysidine synthase
LPRPLVAVAVSGGRDSTALLHCTVRQAQPCGVDVLALHVHHGLMPQADGWLLQVRQQSRRWGAAFDSRRLQGAPGRGESVEAWARTGRYRALAEMAGAHGCDLVLLAHHRRDQAETWLLQALRGAGVAGLAAMPAQAHRGGIVWARPWLQTDPQAIAAYVCRHRLRHAEDPSNADPSFARSRLRRQVWPSLSAAFPGAETAFAAAAAHAQDGLALAREAAQADLSVLLQGADLRCTPWQSLPPARRRNALRAWLTDCSASAPPQSLLDRLLTELPAASTGTWPAPGGVLRLYRGLLRWSPAIAAPVAEAPSPAMLDLSRPGLYPVPDWRGSFEVRPATAGGAAPLALCQVQARARQGGERFSLRPGAPARSLKKQFQTCAVPAWQRLGPLLLSPQGGLVFVPGLGVSAAFQAAAGSPQLQVRWQPDEPGPTGQRQREG